MRENLSWVVREQHPISIFKLVSVLEQAGLNLTLSETPKTAFLTSQHNDINNTYHSATGARCLSGRVL